MAESSSTGGPHALPQQPAGCELKLDTGFRGQCVNCHATLEVTMYATPDSRTCKVHVLRVPRRAMSRSQPPPALASREYPPPLSQEPAPPMLPGTEVVDVIRDELLEQAWPGAECLLAPPPGLSLPPPTQIAPVAGAEGSLAPPPPEVAPVAGTDGLSAQPPRPEVVTVEEESQPPASFPETRRY